MVAININLTAQQKKWVRWAGYPLFALVAFVYALHLTFPYERIEQKLQDWAGADFDVTVASAGPGWFPGDVVIEGVSFKSRPAREGDKPIELNIDRIDLDLGLLSGMTGTTDIEFEAVVGGGTIEGQVVASKNEAVIDIRSSGLPLQDLPGVRTATGGVPMAGGISLGIDVTLPKGKWRDATGKVTIDCEGCTIGDGIAKIRPQAPGQANAFSDGGFTLPKLKLGKVGGQIVIAKGIGHFEEFQGKSPDGEIFLEGDIRFEDPFVKSQVTAYMRFKAADELVKREPKMGDIVAMMKGQAQRPDGYMGLRITGPFSAMRFLGSKTSPVPTKDKGLKDDGRPARPSAAGAGMNRGIGEPGDSGRQPGSVVLPPPATPPPAFEQPAMPVDGATAGGAPPPIEIPPPQLPPQPAEAPARPTELRPSGELRPIPIDDERPTPAPPPEATGEQVPPPGEQQQPPPPPPNDQQPQLQPQQQQPPTVY